MNAPIFSLIISILGLVIYVYMKEPQRQAIGLHMFWVGLLAFLLTWGGELLHHRVL